MVQYTIGVEEEHQVIDPRSGELSALPELGFQQGKLYTATGTLLKRELHSCAVEIDSGICQSTAELAARLREARGGLNQWCRAQGLRFISAASHPRSHWKHAEITEAERYQSLLGELQDLGRSNLIYGLHVHVAVEGTERALQIMNAARVFLPQLLALSASSPFWLGRDTGMASMRSAIFVRMPRTGIPPAFTSLQEYQGVIDSLIATHCVSDATKIWWDLRPHAIFPTLEFRICDVPTRIQDSVTIAALAQALVAKLDRMLRRGEDLQHSHRGFVAENKWRAARHGLGGYLVDFSQGQEKPAAQWLDELLDFVDEVVDDLGSRDDVEWAREIVQQGNSAQRQRQIAAQNGGDLDAVIADLLEQSVLGI